MGTFLSFYDVTNRDPEQDLPATVGGPFTPAPFTPRPEPSWNEALAQYARGGARGNQAPPTQPAPLPAPASQASSAKGFLGGSQQGLLGINSKKGIDLE